MSDPNNNNDSIIEGNSTIEALTDSMLDRGRMNVFLCNALMFETKTNAQNWIKLLKAKQTSSSEINSCISNCESAVNSWNIPIENSTAAPLKGVTLSADGSSQATASSTLTTEITKIAPSTSSTGVKLASAPESYTKKDGKYVVVSLNCIEADVGCNDKFTSMKALQSHLATRKHKIYRFICPLMKCTFSADVRTELEKHRRQNHSQVIKWQCKKCPKCFHPTAKRETGFDGLLQHFNENHYLGEYECVICKHITVTPSKARTHYYSCVKVANQQAQLLSQVFNNPAASAQDSYQFPPPSPFISLNATTIHNTYNHSQQTVDLKKAKSGPFQGPSGSESLVEQNKQTTPPTVHQPIRFITEKQTNTNRLLNARKDSHTSSKKSSHKVQKRNI